MDLMKRRKSMGDALLTSYGGGTGTLLQALERRPSATGLPSISKISVSPRVFKFLHSSGSKATMQLILLVYSTFQQMTASNAVFISFQISKLKKNTKFHK